MPTSQTSRQKNRIVADVCGRLGVAMALAAGLAGAGGCTSSAVVRREPPASATERSDAFPINSELYGKMGYRLDWKGYPTVLGKSPITDVLFAGSGIAVIERGSTLSMLEPAGGGQRCASELANPLTRFLGLSELNGRIVATSEAEIFQLDPATCTLVARDKFPKIISTPPAVAGNFLVVGAPDGEVYAMNSLPGVGAVKMWGFKAEGAIEHRPVIVGPAVAAVSQRGQIVFLRPSDGGLVGQAKIFGGVSTDPVTNGSLLFVASVDQSLYAFSPTGGSEVWRYRTAGPLNVQPTAEGNRVYCAIPGLGLTAFDAATGRVLWSVKGFNGQVISQSKGRLFAFDGTSGVLIDAQRGDIVERAALPGVRRFVVDKFDGGNLFAVSNSGVVAKFQPR